MIKSILCDSRYEVAEKLNELEEKGYNLTMNIIGISQDRGNYTIFYRYSEAIEKGLYSL